MAGAGGLAALTEDPGSIPNTSWQLTAFYNLMPSSDLHRNLTHMWGTCRQNNHTIINKNIGRGGDRLGKWLSG